MRKQSLILIIAVAGILLSIVVTACAPSYVTHTEERRRVGSPNSTSGTQMVTDRIPISCATGKSLCKNGRYYVCTYVSGKCGPCRNVRETYECGTKVVWIYNGSTGEREAVNRPVKCTKTVRRCRLSNLQFTPSDVHNIRRSTLESAARSAMECSPQYNTSYGHHSGNFWLRMRNRDNRCESSVPLD